jgi:flagellar assembly factor FliW
MTVEGSHGAGPDVFTFPAGLPGFADCHRFAVQRPPECEQLYWLVSLDRPDLAFAAVPAETVVAPYRPKLSREDLITLQVGSSQVGLMALAVLTVPAGTGAVTANLRAPLIINPATKIGRQAILASQQYSASHPIGAARA